MPTIKITQAVAVAGVHYAIGDIVSVTQQKSKLLIGLGDAIEFEEPTPAPEPAPDAPPVNDASSTNASPVDGNEQTDIVNALSPADVPPLAPDAPPVDGGKAKGKPKNN